MWSLIRGDVQFSKLSFESPHFTVALSEDMEKTSLELIEEKIRSFVHDLTSLAPYLLMTVQEGKLDLTKEHRVTFSFDTILSRLTASGKSLSISLTCTSNLWDNLSFNTSLHAEDLKSSGTVHITKFQPHNLFTQLFLEMGMHIGDSDADLSVKFKALGLRQIQADVKSSVSKLVLLRDKNRRTELEDMNIQGNIKIEPKNVSVLLSEFNSTHPDLKMSGKYTLDRTSGIMELDLEGKSIDVQSTRKSAVSLGGDISAIRNIFDIVQGGRIPALHCHASGKSPDDFGHLENMRISGRILNGDIYIPVKDLSFKNVTGDVVISKGILEGKNIEASLESHRGSEGNLKIGLRGKDAPFHLDMWMKADMGQLPSLLKHKNLVKNEAVLREMDHLSDTRGIAQGKLILGDRLDSLHVVIDIAQIDVFTRYKPLPFPLTITGGQILFDQNTLKTINLDGSLGNSSFTNLTAKLNLNDKADFEITVGQMTISADEIYPWITTFEKINPVLGGGNPYTIALGVPTSSVGGQQTGPSLFTLRDCWNNVTNRQKIWPLTLPVIDCPGNNTTSCATPVGAVEINVLWITGNNPSWDEVPYFMNDVDGTELWRSTTLDGQARWSEFVAHFGLQDASGNPAAYGDKNIYFKPECKPHIPAGTTGGQNFGILARIPVLVN